MSRRQVQRSRKRSTSLPVIETVSMYFQAKHSVQSLFPKHCSPDVHEKGTSRHPGILALACPSKSLTVYVPCTNDGPETLVAISHRSTCSIVAIDTVGICSSGSPLSKSPCQLGQPMSLLCSQKWWRTTWRKPQKYCSRDYVMRCIRKC